MDCHPWVFWVHELLFGLFKGGFPLINWGSHFVIHGSLLDMDSFHTVLFVMLD